VTLADELQSHIVANHRGALGVQPYSPEECARLFRCRPDLLEYARSEITRLHVRGNRTLAIHDHESKIRCQALERMVKSMEDVPHE
jgi:hypothetical protein